MLKRTTAQIQSDRSNAGRIGAHVMHSRYDARETTKAGRAAFMQRFIDEVDPDRTLPESERNRRAESAKKAYFARLAMKSAKARRRPGKVKGTDTPSIDDAAIETVE